MNTEYKKARMFGAPEVSTPPAAGEAAHTPTPYVARKQYRSNDITLPHYWDVCTVREDGESTVYETVAENLSEQDAAFMVAACNENARLHADKAALVEALETASKQLETLSSRLTDADRAALGQLALGLSHEARAALQSAKW